MVTLNVMLIGGCHTATESSVKTMNLKGVTIDFRGYRDWQSDGEFRDFAEAIVKFKRDFPGVDVKTSVGGEFGYDNDLIIAVATGDAWDLQYAQDSIGVPSAVFLDLIEPLDQYIDWDDPFYDRQFMDLWKLGEHYYGIGNKGFQDFLFLSYKRSTFESAGLTTPYQLYKEGRWNFETCLEAAKVLMEQNSGAAKPRYMFYTSTIECYSAQAISPYNYNSSDGTLTLNINTPEMRNYLQFIYDIGFVNNAVKVSDGDVIFEPMYTTYFAIEQIINKWDSDGMEIVPLPTKNGIAHTYMHDNYLTVPKGAKNKEAAILLAKYICTERENYMNTTIKRVLSPEQYNMYMDLCEDFFVKRMNLPGIDNLLSFSNAKAGEVLKIITKGLDVDTFLEEAESKLQPQIDLYNNNYASKVEGIR